MNEWVWSIGGMILTGKTEVLREKHYTAWVVDEWMSVEYWWNDTDRRNWSAGRKTLYNIGGRWMNEYGGLVERYWQGKAGELWVKPVPVPNSSPNPTFTEVGSIFDLLEFVLPSSPSPLPFLDVCVCSSFAFRLSLFLPFHSPLALFWVVHLCANGKC